MPFSPCYAKKQGEIKSDFQREIEMSVLELEHFKRAAAEIGAHGDNDTLPFEIDTRFISEEFENLANIAFEFASRIESVSKKEAVKTLNAIQMFSERLLTPTGYSGFQITTKIHPFWNLYFNGLGIAIAEKHESVRSDRAHAYRFAKEGATLFDRSSSWRAFREATIKDCLELKTTGWKPVGSKVG